MMFRNKKGDVPDMLVWIVTITILAIGMFIFAFVIPEITTGLEEAGMNSSIEGTFAIDTLAGIGSNTIQKGFFFLFAGLVMGVLVSSFFVRTHPIFMFIYIIFLGISILLAVYLGNFYETLTGTVIFADTLASQGLINIVMENIVKITLGVGALSMIIVFAKFSGIRVSGRQDL